MERLLTLPVGYWSQLIMVEQENIEPAHIIENANAYYSTPDIKGNYALELLAVIQHMC